jgi:MFS family permease
VTRVARLSALREVLATRDFRRLYSVRLIGQFSDGLLQAALTTFVLFSPERQPDAVKVAAAFAILLLPYSIIGPFAGVFLDRWRRRDVLVRANLVKAIATLPIIALVFVGNDGLLLGLTVLVVLGVGRFVLAGLSASLPHVVTGRDLITANALTPTSGTIAAAVGAVAGVSLRTLVGGGDPGSMLILVLAATGFVAAGLTATRIGRLKLGPSGEKPADTIVGVALGMVDGIRQMGRAPIAGRAIAVAGAHRVAFGALTVTALLLVRNTFNSAAEADAALNEFAVITGFAAAGALIAAVLTPGATRRFSAVTWSIVVLVQAGVLGVGLVYAGAMTPSMPLLLAGAASIGFAGQGVKVCADTLVQRHVRDDHLGRVFSIFDMVLNVCLVTGITVMAFGAPSSGQAPALILGIGALLLGTAFWYRWASRRRLKPHVT